MHTRINISVFEISFDSFPDLPVETPPNDDEVLELSETLMQLWGGLPQKLLR